jgi:hypothetical protein
MADFAISFFSHFFDELGKNYSSINSQATLLKGRRQGAQIVRSEAYFLRTPQRRGMKRNAASGFFTRSSFFLLR